ncbi:hypothetical protein SPRG_02467 [Saprolegnia parasitica CBS 223.65]|uniref:EF-hand domain-containing protein n=1 Tax=Saprolegnia parasitica (strain CBS 223.65) TaxID=695850 RepID=A0A067CQ17_SAPPC|nr:hypothetical protein SPRG_02467 [Saprolegnia parasitica CBS 223.65]KDO32769.1 hypothetical protein SPRG_02467 [Saprolegnia parasitica CBS 223.65]|eukprot:XP_012196433.1 hypothetical protein SPRG_02467 [Saprolegnia parasitica CBS 223.65]
MASKVRVHGTGSSNRLLCGTETPPPTTPRAPSRAAPTTPRFVRPATCATPTLMAPLGDSASNQFEAGAPERPREAPQKGRRPNLKSDAIRSPTAPTNHIPNNTTKEAAIAEFVALLQAKYECTKSLRAAFRSWDINHDGQLSQGEMKDMFTTMGWASQLGHEKVDALIRSVVDPSTQCVSYHAFCQLVLPSQPMDKPQRQHILQEIEFGQSVLGEHVGDPAESGPEMGACHVVYTLRNKYEKMKLGTVFRLWDQNKEGKLSLDMILKNLEKQNINVSSDTVQELLHTYDADKDGMLSFYEFANIMNGPVLQGHDRVLLRKLRRSDVVAPPPSKVAPPADIVDAAKLSETVYAKLKVYKNRILQSFGDMDDDSSGKLTYAEFRHGLMKKGIVLSEAEFRHLTNDMDADHDGLISLWEFTTQFKQLIKMDEAKDFGLQSSLPSSWAEEPLPAKPEHGTLPKFDFAQLRARTTVPTRSGHTPRDDTKELLCGPKSPLNPWRFANEGRLRFEPESTQYGRGNSVNSVASVDKERQRVRHAYIQGQMAQMRVDEQAREDAVLARQQMRDKAKVADHIRQRTQYYMRLKQRAERDSRLFD